MCGIVGYVGNKSAAGILLDALEKLEYRGYDSAGIALAGREGISVYKTRGRIKKLREMMNACDQEELDAFTVGIGHTRWATHGEPSDCNSHPHLSQSGRVAVVHNGIIENYLELRAFLIEHGHTFVTETDSEVVSELIDYYYSGDPVYAVRKAEVLLKGSYAIGILFSDYPWQIMALRKDGPLIIGLGDGENFIASDIPAILKHTRNIFRLGERELAILSKDGVTVMDSYGERITHEVEHVEWDVDAAEKGGYPHFMIKEIMEQPGVIERTIESRLKDGRISFGFKHITDEELGNINNIRIVACGSAYHVGVVAKSFMKKTLHIPVEAELASEFRYDDPIVDEHTLVIIISQSGETLDTLYGLREARNRGARTVAVVNVVASSIANESEEVLYTWAGPEIAVATTKAYSAQLILMHLINWKLAEAKGLMSEEEISKAIDGLKQVPGLLAEMLKDVSNIQYLASLFFNSQSVFFIGRNIDYALSLEASLKLKEISYIHSEAYAAGELKHGSISLIEEGTLVIALCSYRPLLDKMISNIKEVKARGAKVIAVINNDDTETEKIADHVIRIPECSVEAIPSLTIVPLQLFAYYIASHKGCDIDKPRNLAKSVTVE